MFPRSLLLCSRRFTIQLQSSTRHFSFKGPVKRPQANSVLKTRFDRFHRRPPDSSPNGLGWLFFDLYRISFDQLSPLEFFGLHELPQPSVDQELLSNADAHAMQKNRHNGLIYLVDDILIPAPSTSVVQFAAELFEVVGYLGGDRIAYNWMEVPFALGGKLKHVKCHVCIVDLSLNEILLVAEEHRMTEHGGLDAAQIKLVAGAVAAFNYNNLQRGKANLPPLAEKVIPGIVMAGSSPSFFKIPVTETLSSHIRNGSYPPFETRVTYCYNTVHHSRRHEGMKPLDNRREILKCCEAFKPFVGEK